MGLFDIFIQPDRAKRDEHAKQEAAEAAAAAAPKPIFADGQEVVTQKVGEAVHVVAKTATQDVEASPAGKLRLEKVQEALTEKATLRQEHCWMREGFGCQGRATHHVREVRFDLRSESASTDKHAFVSTNDYGGPVPGFCIGCIATGPKVLADAVYQSRPEIQWGFRPNRWFVVFTDGSKQGGLCQEIALHHTNPTYVEAGSAKEHTP